MKKQQFFEKIFSFEELNSWETIRGIKTVTPALFPDIISAFITY